MASQTFRTFHIFVNILWHHSYSVSVRGCSKTNSWFLTCYILSEWMRVMRMESRAPFFEHHKLKGGGGWGQAAALLRSLCLKIFTGLGRIAKEKVPWSPSCRSSIASAHSTTWQKRCLDKSLKLPLLHRMRALVGLLKLQYVVTPSKLQFCSTVSMSLASLATHTLPKLPLEVYNLLSLGLASFVLAPLYMAFDSCTFIIGHIFREACCRLCFDVFYPDRVLLFQECLAEWRSGSNPLSLCKRLKRWTVLLLAWTLSLLTVLGCVIAVYYFSEYMHQVRMNFKESIRGP